MTSATAPFTAKEFQTNVIKSALANGWTKQEILNNPHKAADLYIEMQKRAWDELGAKVETMVEKKGCEATLNWMGSESA